MWRRGLLGAVLLDVYINCLTLLFAWVGSVWEWSTGTIGLHVLVALLVVCIGVAVYSRLTVLFDRLLGGDTEKKVEEYLLKFPSKITTILGMDELRGVLKDIGSRLGVEQMAFYLEQSDNLIVDILSSQPGPCQCPNWSVLSLPLKIKEKQVGVWCLGTLKRDGIYTGACQERLQTLAAQLAAVVEIIWQRETVQQQAEAMLSAERMAALGRMSAEIAHQFNGPLFVIRSAIVAHNDNNKDTLPHWLAMAYQVTQELGEKVAHMTKFVQPIRDEAMAQVDVNNAVYQAINYAQTIIKANAIVLNTCFSNQIPDVLVWPSDLPDAVFNLIKNACEAMVDGGELFVETAVEGSWAIIRVRDTGHGIAQSDLRHLFDPFFTRKENGTGFGLPIAYAIIERARGAITVESKIGAGSCFAVKLPLQKRLDQPLEGVQWHEF
jgi:signal transduction histidine kinase